MLRRVQKFIRDRELLKAGARVLVCVSGGADSVALLDVLVRGGYDCVVAHCNFHLRGEESDRDEQTVRSIVADLRVRYGGDKPRDTFLPLLVKHFDTQAYAAQRHISLEMAARELRYDWFAQAAADEQCAAIAVAHHQNDQAETLLLNLKRGTGLRGLCGMRAESANPVAESPIPIVRPLLCTTRDYIEHYLRDIRHIHWVTDSSNADLSIPRNAVREQLSRYTKAEIEHIAATAERLQGYADMLDNRRTFEALRTSQYEKLRPYNFPQTDEIIEAFYKGSTERKEFYAPHYKAIVQKGSLKVIPWEQPAHRETPTRRHFGIIGNPLGHSYSARYFSDKFEREGIPADYKLFPMEDLSGLEKLTKRLNGYNVTYPYKEEIIHHLKRLDGVAAAIGAVNVVAAGKGYNTDWIGFVKSIEPVLRSGDDYALVLGTGGVSKAVQYALQQLGIQYQMVSRHAAPGIITYEDITPEMLGVYTIIINCTPLGMTPDESSCPAIPYEHLSEKNLLFDCVYNPAETTFMRLGKQHGARVKNGLEMLQLQAEAAWKIWSKNVDFTK